MNIEQEGIELETVNSNNEEVINNDVELEATQNDNQNQAIVDDDKTIFTCYMS